MSKRFTRAVLALSLGASVFVGSAAWGIETNQLSAPAESSQAIFKQTQEEEPEIAIPLAPVATQAVITDRSGVRVVEIPLDAPLNKSLKANGLKPMQYHNEDGTPVSKAPPTLAEPIFLFKLEYRGSAAQVKIPAPVTTLRVNGLPEGTEVVQAEGSDGLGLMTTIIETDLSADKLKNDVAPKRRKVTTTETLTVITAPVARVILVGAIDNLSDRSAIPPVEGECGNGTSVPETVDPNIIAIHRAVCIQYPAIQTYGTLRSSCPVTCEHRDGIAVDIMLDDEPGWPVAAYLAANYKLYNLNYIIYRQQIWQPSTGTWRKMEDRGSATANHMDHVHVSVYPSAVDKS